MTPELLVAFWRAEVLYGNGETWCAIPYGWLATPGGRDNKNTAGAADLPSLKLVVRVSFDSRPVREAELKPA